MTTCSDSHMTDSSLLNVVQERSDLANPERLAFLYANILPLKARNTSSFNTVVAWWHQLLLELIPKASQDHLVLHANGQLLARLATEESGRPLGLGCVLHELSTEPPFALVRLGIYLDSTLPLAARYQQSWPRWIATNFMAKPLWWILGQLNVADNSRPQASSQAADLWSKSQGDWVAVELVQREAQRICFNYRIQGGAAVGPLNRLFSVQSFQTSFCPHLSDLDVKVILKYLSRDQPELIFDSERKVVKWLSDANAGPEQSNITESDAGIVQLKSTIDCLSKQVNALEGRVQSAHSKAAFFASKKQQDQAKAALRSKKALQDVLFKRQGSLFTLESIWLGIEQATGDVEILRAYDNASTTLRQVLKAPEFERLDQTMDNLTEAMSEQQDLEHALRTASDATALPNVDEEELLQELEQLTLTPASSQKKSTNNAEPQQELPSAPMIEPQKAQAPKTETVQQNRQGQAIQAT